MNRTTCSICNSNKLREVIGKHPSGVKIYRDQDDRRWKGRKCPDCLKQEHKQYMREVRGSILLDMVCKFCSKNFKQKRRHQKYCSAKCRKLANPWRKVIPILPE